MPVTAKVKCTRKQPVEDHFGLSFDADYADGRNADWARYTPHLRIDMTVNAKAAEHFEQGQAYTLTFEPDEG